MLYSGQTVQRPIWAGLAAPLVSAAGHAELFGATAYFAAGQTNPISGAPGWTTHTHNGGADFGAGAWEQRRGQR